MPYQAFSINIDDVVRILDLERDPKEHEGAASYNVRCPFCGNPNDKKYKMNINSAKGVYFCPKCMDSSVGNSGALDLYGRVRFGTPLRPGHNGKQLFHSLMLEIEGNSAFRTRKNDERKDSQPPMVEEILPAPNDALDRAYRTLLSLPYLAISDNHTAKLLERGLDAPSIQAGMYASLIDPDLFLKNHPKANAADEWYRKNQVEKTRKNNSILRGYTKEEILAGLIIARDMSAAGVPMENVPGFFKLCGAWCFRYTTGMIIPTVSIDGNIVGLQIRRDVTTKAGLRYMTVSSKGLDGGVTTKIARTHIAHDTDVDASTTLYVTEGPLKANVILHLLKKNGLSNIAVIAIQGVNNTKELPEMVRWFYEKGIRICYSALDMDKLTNMNVAKAGTIIKSIFLENGMEIKTLYWDKDYAMQMYKKLSAICQKNSLSVPHTANVFTDLYTMAHDLYVRGISFNEYVVDGKKYKEHWGNTKGLDDYLRIIA